MEAMQPDDVSQMGRIDELTPRGRALASTADLAAENLLPKAYGCLNATLSWAILTNSPSVARILDLLEEVDRLLDELSDAGLIPIRARSENYGQRYDWVLERLTHLATTDERFARIASIEARRFEFLPGMN